MSETSSHRKIEEIDKGVLKVSNFSPNAIQLRNRIESQFGSPLKGSSDRFVWDYWSIKNQYTLLRTPLEAIFSEEQTQDLLDELGLFAQKELGLMALSHPWISAYVDGCFQEFHTDPNHGPWAFVYSLTPDEFFEKFSGGETQILKNFTPHQNEDSLAGVPQERSQISQEVQSKFNELCIFDPRRPHKVNPVRGVHDILEARIVIHGWFTDPQPFLDGDLNETDLQKCIDIGFEETEKFFEEEALSGHTVLKISKDNNGWVISAGRHLLVDCEKQTYLNNEWQESLVSIIQKRIEADVKTKDSDFTLTLPIVYQSEKSSAKSQET